MIYSPHKYQEYVSSYIEDNEISAIFLDMGLGKTVITLTAIKNLLFDSFEVSKILVIAPLRVARDTWKDEINKWNHLKDIKYSVVVGSLKERKTALNEKADIYIINRENIDWLIKNDPFNFDMVVIDELSSFKNHKAKRFKALISKRAEIKRIVGLTGTPASNGLMDLWAQFRILDSGKRLGRFISKYREIYFRPGRRNGMIIFDYILRDGAEEEIYEKISDITISMKTEDYIKLPDVSFNEINVHMNESERSVYDSLKDDFVIIFKDKEIDAKSAAVLSNKLLQLSNGAIYDNEHNTINIHDRKLDALEDLIEGANGKPVLIAYWFKSDLDRIKERFDVCELKTSDDFSKWNEGKIPVAIIHPASAGHGLNLQAGGSTLIWFSLTWSLELYQQTNKRLHRQGQKESVVIHHIICKDTIDEDVMKALRLKDKTQSTLINAVKARLGD